MIPLRVPYKYGAKRRSPTTTRANEGLLAEAWTESAVMVALRTTARSSFWRSVRRAMATVIARARCIPVKTTSTALDEFG